MGCNCFLYLPSPVYFFSPLLSFYSDVLSYTLVKFFDDKYAMLYSSRLISKRDTLYLTQVVCVMRPPLWSSGQSFWLQIQRSRVRFPALPDFSE